MSGVGFSNVGPFTEIHDHSNFENDHFVLMGFLNPSLTNKSQSDREENIREQLFKFFGEEGKKYLSYEEKVWNNENLLNFENNTFLSPLYNKNHPIYQ